MRLRTLLARSSSVLESRPRRHSPASAAARLRQTARPTSLVAPETTKFQYTDGVADVSRIDPDNWVHDQALLDRPGNAEIQMDLFYDYRTNLPLYPAVQAYFRKHRPPTLLVWGKNDKIFPADGAHPYKRDLPDVEFHLIDTGHFALEDKADEMVPLIRGFLDRKVARK